MTDSHSDIEELIIFRFFEIPVAKSTKFQHCYLL